MASTDASVTTDRERVASTDASVTTLQGSSQTVTEKDVLHIQSTDSGDLSDPEKHLKADSSGVSNGDESEEEFDRGIHGIKWVLAYFCIVSTVLFYALDGTIVADIQPPIIDSLGGADKLPWIGIALALGAIMILPLGKAYGVFNVKWLFLTMVVTFEVGSALCGAAPTMDAFIVGRVIQGLGGCGCYIGSITFISHLTTPRERPLYLSGVLIVWGIGSVVGPLVGGGFAQSSAGWRWAFYINLIIAVVSAPGLIWCLPSLNPMDIPFTQKLKTQDWLGITIFSAGSVCFTMALAFGGTIYPFGSASGIVLWVMTGVLLVVFGLVTYYHPFVAKEHRLYPVHLFKNIQLSLLKLEIFMAMGSMMTALYYIPLLFQFSRGDTPLEAGIRLLPFMCSLIAAEVINGWLMPKFGYYMPWYVCGNVLILAGGAAMITLDRHTSDSEIYGFTALIGAGCGLYFTAGFAVAGVLIPPSELQNSVGFMTIGQGWGQIVLLSLAGSLYQNIAIGEISELMPEVTRMQAFQLATGRHSHLYDELTPDLQDHIVRIVTVSIRNAFSIIVPAGAIALIASLFLSRKKIY